MDVEFYRSNKSEHLSGHSHQTLHICHVRRGGFEEQVNNGWQECGAGMLRVSPSQTSHDLRFHSTGIEAEIIELNGRLQRGLPRPLTQSHFVSADRYRSVVESMSREWLAGNRFGAESAALELVAAAVSNNESSPPRWLCDLREELEGRLDQSYSLAQFASRYGRHRSHLARIFRRYFGRSIGEHIQAYRIYTAAARLEATDQSLSSLALDLGFCDQAHFTRMFSRTMGVSPARYRCSRRSSN